MEKSNFSSSYMSALEVEATSLLEVIKLAAKNGFQFVQFKTDGKILVAAMNSSCTISMSSKCHLFGDKLIGSLIV